MYDKAFFINTFSMKKDLIAGKEDDFLKVEGLFEESRSKKPKVFNIETTNYCNMTCKMCPRTTLMTRDLKHMEDETFEKIINEVTPYSKEEIESWADFVSNKINILKDEQSEDAFYFNVCSKCVLLHGYGEPVLNPKIVKRVEMLSKKGVPTYFSCNPSNINYEQMEELFKAGVSYIKFSIDSISDEGQKSIRGKNADFNSAYKKILNLLDLKNKKNYETTLVITMILLSKEQEKEANEFIELFKDKNVFSYIKSQDNKWYYKDEKEKEAKNHYHNQYCEFPWTSLTVMSNGSIVPCTQDYNAEMVFGNIVDTTLEEVWNSKKYDEFRHMHLTGEKNEKYKCDKRCDLKLVKDYLKKETGK